MPDEVVIVGADGVEHVFPAGFNPKHAAAIVKNGGSAALPSKPVSAEDFTGPQMSAGEKAMRALGGLGRSTIGGAVETAKALADLQGGVLGGNMEALNRTTGRIRGIIRAQADQFRKAGNSQTASEAIGHAVAGALPLVGPAAAAVGEKFETDPYGAAGEAAGMIGAPAIARGAAKGAQALPAAGRAVAGAARGAIEPVARGLMSDTPVLTQLRQGATKKILGRIIPKEPSPNAGGVLNKTKAPTAESAISDVLRELDTADAPRSVELPPQPGLPPGYTPRSSSPAPKTSGNEGGRLVRQAQPSLEQELADALSERAPEPPARISTPPQPDLPPGYTPRTSAPKPKMAKATMEPKAAQTSKPAASYGPRNYFLKKDAPATPIERVEPRTLGVEDLPASWQSRITQPLMKREAGMPSVDDVTSELGGRGLSIADAMDAVQRNASLAPNVRLQLREALLAALGQQ